MTEKIVMRLFVCLIVVFDDCCIWKQWTNNERKMAEKMRTLLVGGTQATVPPNSVRVVFDHLCLFCKQWTNNEYDSRNSEWMRTLMSLFIWLFFCCLCKKCKQCKWQKNQWMRKLMFFLFFLLFICLLYLKPFCLFVCLANGGRNSEWMRTLMSDSDGAMTGSADYVMSGIQCSCYIVTAWWVEHDVAYACTM